ncbi:hypothetical protein [Desulfitobacterium sp. AusDCA]|uniref:hypothetical protein n=1 Tax=Desulfitobacterium sp. AusDCA TaxID=3240383 RepID=UPI003DA71751
MGDGNLSGQDPTLFTQLIDQIMSLNISGSSGDTADGINNLIQLYIGSNSQSNAASCQDFRIYTGQVFPAGTVNLN